MNPHEGAIRQALQQIFTRVTNYLEARSGTSVFDGARLAFASQAPLDTSARIEGGSV